MSKRVRKALVVLSTLVLVLAPAHAAALAAGRELTVGVTLLPYYSWVAALTDGTPVRVVPVMGANGDAHAAQGSPEDVKRLGNLDALVINGLGHDDFIKPMIEAAGNKTLTVIKPSSAVALIAYAGETHGHDGGPVHTHAAGYNPHTFIALTSAIQQVLVIEQALAKLDPAHAAAFRANAVNYTRSLRKMKSDALARLSRAGAKRVATVHDGYAYLLNELGLSQHAVIEPSHGTMPSAGQLAKTISAIRAADVKIVLSEITFPEKLTAIITKETGARVYTLDHMGGGSFTKDAFTKAMQFNLDTIVRALAETR